MKGLADAIKKKAVAIGTNGVLVEYMRAQQWSGQMSSAMMGEGQNVLWAMDKK